MSLIGPRPLRPKNKLEILSYITEERFNILPGIIGPAQISLVGWKENPKIYFKKDLDYLKKITFLNDLKIYVKFFISYFLNTK